jgi:hypothetical protein
MDIDDDGVMAMGPVTALNGDDDGDGHVYVHTYTRNTCSQTSSFMTQVLS